MKRLALIGHPVQHSVSPAFQNAALVHCGVMARYEAIDTPDDALSSVIAQVRGPEWLGANVTVPHKEAVFGLVDEVDDQASQVGAVNTIVNRDGRLFATNTDIAGFQRSVEASDFALWGKRSLVLGAGGAARAVTLALARSGAVVAVTNRSGRRAERLVEWIGQSSPTTSIRVLRWDDEKLVEEAIESDLLVNCTSLGMWHGPDESASPLPREAFRSGQLAVDLVYNPLETPFLVLARVAGAQPISGLEMLIQQGAAAFELWTGLRAPVNLMRRVAREALVGRVP